MSRDCLLIRLETGSHCVVLATLELVGIPMHSYGVLGLWPSALTPNLTFYFETGSGETAQAGFELVLLNLDKAMSQNLLGLGLLIMTGRETGS